MAKTNKFARSAKKIGSNVKKGVNTYYKGVNKIIDNSPIKAAEEMIGSVPKVGKVLRHVVNPTKMLAQAPLKLMEKLTNHPSWYVKDAISNTGLNFNSRLGQIDATNDTQIVSANQSIVLTIPGSADNEIETSAVEYTIDEFRTAVDIMYRRLRASNSGRANYEPNHLAKYLLDFRLYRAALVACVSKVNVLNNIHINNKLTPLYTVRSLGIDDNELEYLEENRGNLIDLLNYEISVFNKSMRMLPDMSIFDRDEWLLSNIFMDSPNIKSIPLGNSLNTYQPVLDDEGNFETLEVDLTGASMITTLRNLRNRISTDINTNLIQGDIEKIQPSNSYVLTEVNIMASIPEVFDEYLNSQMKNSVAMNNVTAFSGTYASVCTITSNSLLSLRGENTLYDVTITSSKNDPSLGEQLSMLQFSSPIKTSADGSAYKAFVMSTTSADIKYYVVSKDDGQPSEIDWTSLRSVSDVAVYDVLALSQVDHMPMLRYYNTTNDHFLLAGNLEVTAIYSAIQAEILTSIVCSSIFNFGATSKSGYKDR